VLALKQHQTKEAGPENDIRSWVKWPMRCVNLQLLFSLRELKRWRCTGNSQFVESLTTKE
jgi:hypothetical protein